MPRSASTWSFNVCVELLRRLRPGEDIHAGFADELSEFLASAPDSDHVVVKCHGLDDGGRALLRDGRAQAIYTHRDPADAVASAMQMFDTPFPDALAAIEASLVLHREHRRAGTALILAYDDIVGAPIDAVGAIAAYLGLDAAPELLDAVAAATSLDRARELSSNLRSHSYDRTTLLHPGHVRDGSSGYGRAKLTPEQLTELEATVTRYEIDERYEQEAEYRFLAAVLDELHTRAVVDVGAERGSFVNAALEAGVERVVAVEPAPDNVQHLRERFGDDDRVTIVEVAIADADGTASLRLATDESGSPLSYAHTLLEREAADEVQWSSFANVATRTLSSLARDGVIPEHIGILKIDTEGSDFAVVRGLGDVACDVVVVEHWLDLPASLGRCPWTAEDLVAELAPRGFSHFAFFVHAGEFTFVQWDDATIEPGAMGNLVFLHDRVVERSMPYVLASASESTRRVVRLAAERAAAATERDRLLVELRGEYELQARAATERLERIDALEAQLRKVAADRDVHAAAAAERREQIEALAANIAAQRQGIDDLTRDRDVQAAAARDRLDRAAALEAQLREIAADRDVHAVAATERLEQIETLSAELAAQRELLHAIAHDRDVQAAAAAERLAELEALAAERDTQAAVAAERLEALVELQRGSTLYSAESQPE